MKGKIPFFVLFRWRRADVLVSKLHFVDCERMLTKG